MAVRARRDLIRSACVLALLAPVTTWAAGLEVPENGAGIMARGGTAASYSGTAYALEFNPAALADVNNFDVRVDVRVTWNDVKFTRAPHYNNNGLDTTFGQVQNEPGPFAAPGFYIAERLKGLPLVASFGVFGPPAIGAYRFPHPKRLSENPDAIYDEVLSKTGQRYQLIGNNNQILLPTAGIGWKINDWVSVGLSLGVAVASLDVLNAVAGASAGGAETVQADAFAHVNVAGFGGPIVIPGVMFRPVKGLNIGAAYRSPFQLNLPGVVNVSALPDAGAITLPKGNKVSLSLWQPQTARLGVSYDIGPVTLALEGTYEGWSINKEVVLDGSSVDVVTTTGSSTKTINLGKQILPKHWIDAYSGRLGGTVRILNEKDHPIGLSVSLGGLYETNAIPSEWQQVDAVTGNRTGGSLGVTATWHGIGLTLAAMGYLPTHLEIANSKVARSVSGETAEQAEQDDNVIVGNGTYDSSLWIMTIGLSFSG